MPRQLSQEDIDLTQDERDTRDSGKQYQGRTVNDAIAILIRQRDLGRGAWLIGPSKIEDLEHVEKGVTVTVKSPVKCINIRHHDGS